VRDLQGPAALAPAREFFAARACYSRAAFLFCERRRHSPGGFMLWNLRTCSSLALVLALLTARPGSAQGGLSTQAFNVIDPGTLCRNTVPCGNERSQPTNAWAVNAFGEVVGNSETDPFGISPVRAFLWTQGPLANLGTIAGKEATFARGISNARQVVGYAGSRDSENTVPFAWQGSSLLQLPTFGGEGRAWAINNGGLIVGQATASDGRARAVYWRIDSPTTLTNLGFGVARAVNDFEQIAGWTVSTDGLQTHAARWAQGSLLDLGTLGGTFSQAFGISSEQRIVGLSTTASGNRHAFVWDATNGMRDLGTLGGANSTAMATEGPWIVGSSEFEAGNLNTHAFLYDLRDGVMIDLNSRIPPGSGWTLINATAVTSAGIIVGYGAHGASTRAFRLENWTSFDIGDITVGGATSYHDGEFTVSGSGGDIWGTDDAFRFVYQQIWGDAEIVARVTSLENTNEFAKAGVMMREGLTPGSATVILDVKPDGGIEYMVRDATGAEMRFLQDGQQQAPVWLKLRRMGRFVDGFYSADGITWHAVNTTGVPFRSFSHAGLAVTSHDVGVAMTARFDHVSVMPNWTSRDVGFTSSTEQPPGGTVYTIDDAYVTHATGADIWGTNDEFHFIHTRFRGAAQLEARVASLTADDEFAKAGVMLRASFDPDAATVILDVRPNGELEFMVRRAKGEEMNFIAGGHHNAPIYLRLIRGTAFVDAQWSADGETWAGVGQIEIDLPDLLYGGFAVTSRDVSSVATAVIDKVKGSSSRVP
jgi:probable HAF family extracellular repeat protein